jgi:hypothetical protein
MTNKNPYEAELNKLLSQPISERSDVLWDVNIHVKSQGKLSRIASINHAIEFTLSQNEQEATIKLAA